MQHSLARSGEDLDRFDSAEHSAEVDVHSPVFRERREKTSGAVHHLLGPEMRESTGVKEMNDGIYSVSEAGPHTRMNDPMKLRQMQKAADGTRVEQGSGIEVIEKPTMTNAQLGENLLAVGITTGGASVATATLETAALMGIQGATTLAAAVAAAPLTGGTLGYIVGKRWGHPIAGAATGAAITSIGTAIALDAAVGGTAAGAISGAALAGAAWPAALSGMITYGLGAAHNYVWSGSGKPKPSILGTYLRGVVAPVTIPVGLVYALSKRLTGGGKPK